MIKILKHFWKFILYPSDHKLFPQYRNSYTKIFFTLLLLGQALLLIILPIVLLIDKVTPLTTTQSGFMESPYTLFIVACIFVPLIEEFFFRYYLKYRQFYGHAFSYKAWRKYYRWILYASSLTFAIIHVGNFHNQSTLFYFLAIFLVSSQLIGGFTLAFLRVRMGFRYAFYFHMLWNFLAFFSSIITLPFYNPMIDKKQDDLSLQVNVINFRDRSKEKFEVQKDQENFYKLTIKQYPLGEIIDSLYGKNNYQVMDMYLNIDMKSKQGIKKEQLLKILQEELTIIKQEKNTR